MTFDTHLSMTTHKMGEYWFSEEVKFQCLHNTSGIAVKLSKWTRDVGVTRNVVFVGELGWYFMYCSRILLCTYAIVYTILMMHILYCV